MRHTPFLKLISRELVAGRMVDVGSVSICRCGKKFSTDEGLEAHVQRPITLELVPTEEPELREEFPAPPSPEQKLVTTAQGA
jgi:hypothetical protein